MKGNVHNLGYLVIAATLRFRFRCWACWGRGFAPPVALNDCLPSKHGSYEYDAAKNAAWRTLAREPRPRCALLRAHREPRLLHVSPTARRGRVLLRVCGSASRVGSRRAGLWPDAGRASGVPARAQGEGGRVWRLRVVAACEFRVREMASDQSERILPLGVICFFGIYRSAGK